VKRRDALVFCLALLLSLAVPAVAAAQTPPAPVARHLFRFDVASPPREFDQVLLIVDIPPGGATPTHTHGGQLLVTVLEGEPAFQVRGGALRRFKVGETWVENPGEFGVASNPGTTKVRLGATAILPKGAALTTDDAGQTSPNAPVGATTVHRVSLPVTNPPTPLEVAQFVVEFPAGSWSPWHTHGGPGFVLVTDGEATHEMSGMQHRYKAGEAWIDPADVVHRAGAQSGAPVAVFSSFLLPKGATLTTNQPGQTGAAPGAAPTAAAPTAAAPTQLPRTGGTPFGLVLLAAGGLIVAGAVLRRPWGG
jgi:quercetin dioxygenase-like cupin family protein